MVGRILPHSALTISIKMIRNRKRRIPPPNSQPKRSRWQRCRGHQMPASLWGSKRRLVWISRMICNRRLFLNHWEIRCILVLFILARRRASRLRWHSTPAPNSSLSPAHFAQMQRRRRDLSLRSSTQSITASLIAKIRPVGAWIKASTSTNPHLQKLLPIGRRKSITDRLSSTASFSKIILVYSRCRRRSWRRRRRKRQV